MDEKATLLARWSLAGPLWALAALCCSLCGGWTLILLILGWAFTIIPVVMWAGVRPIPTPLGQKVLVGIALGGMGFMTIVDLAAQLLITVLTA